MMEDEGIKVDQLVAFPLLANQHDRKRNIPQPEVLFPARSRQKGVRLTTLSED